jgi:hypothetical protein
MPFCRPIRQSAVRLLVSFALLQALPARGPGYAQTTPPLHDPRNLKHGSLIPSEGYSDQPYVIVTQDGTWLCVMTTGKGVEGAGGQHLIAIRSQDQGRTWSAPVDIEPASGPEASWGVPFKTPGGRVYVFYTYNKANLREVPQAKAARHRVDTLGVYAFRYSDDGGRTWSKERFEIPLHATAFDRENNFGGQTLFFWGVSKPIVHQGAVYWGWNRVTRWGTPGTLARSQGHFMRSDNLLTEPDPRKLHWQILPDSDAGLRAPKGPIAEEANLVSLNDGSLYATFRTIDGYLGHAYSRDHGHTWSAPAYATFTPTGRRIKHPRAYGPVWKLSNGKYLLWFHHHGGEPVHTAEWGKGSYYQNRNPVWLAGGVERAGQLYWSEPEVLLYDDDPNVRMSYPDLIEETINGRHRYFITETQKTTARVHELDPTLLEGLWRQFDQRSITRSGLVLDLTSAQTKPGAALALPPLPNLATGAGFTIEGWVRWQELSPGQVLFDARDSQGKGLALQLSDRFTLKLIMNDGTRESSWDSDPGTVAGTLKTNVWQHFAVIVDGGPKLISFVIDGVLNDGGATRQFGWGRFSPALADVNGLSSARLAPDLYGEVRAFRIYNRALRTSEAVSNFRAEAPPQ